MFKKKKVLITTLVVLFSAPLIAEEKKPEPTWKGEAELGFISTSGNTETETLNAKAKVINERDKWKHTLIAEATKASSDGVVSARRSFVSGKTAYKYSVRAYSFALLEYEDDRFSGFDYQARLVVGYGRKLITEETLALDAEIGFGAKHSELDSGDTNDEGILYAGMELDWKISKTATFNEKLTVERGDDATTTKSVSGLKAKINSKLASKMTYTLKHVSEVPPGVENTDRELAVTLVYSF